MSPPRSPTSARRRGRADRPPAGRGRNPHHRRRHGQYRHAVHPERCRGQARRALRLRRGRRHARHAGNLPPIRRPVPPLSLPGTTAAGHSRNLRHRGVLGPAVQIVAAAQAADVLKIAAGAPGALSGTMLEFDVWSNTRRRLDLKNARDPSCTCCGGRIFEFLDKRRGFEAKSLCGQHAVQIRPAGVGTRSISQRSRCAACLRRGRGERPGGPGEPARRGSGDRRLCRRPRDRLRDRQARNGPDGVLPLRRSLMGALISACSCRESTARRPRRSRWRRATARTAGRSAG